MPNVKISELPAASTPLAGTELVPVVQGGVTEQVTVADLTTGRAVSASDVTVSNLTASQAVLTDANKKLVSQATTGTGDVVRATGPTVTLTNATGLPLTTGVTGTLPVANGGTGVTASTGSGANVLGTGPTLSGATLNGTTVFGGAVTPAANTADSVGYTGTPINSQSAAYPLVASDAGKSIVHPISDNNPRTFTIPANGTVPFPVGTTITFINLINTVTIAIATDTMYLAGAGTTGSRTLAAYGMATAVKVTATSWIISGNGLT